MYNILCVHQASMRAIYIFSQSSNSHTVTIRDINLSEKKKMRAGKRRWMREKKDKQLRSDKNTVSER